MNFPVEAWVSTGTGQSDCVWVSKLSGRLAPHAQTLTSCVWEFKSVLWWCVTGCIYVWPPAVPSYQNAGPVWIITVYRHTEAELTPPLRQAPLCWHLKNQTALSSETWDLQAEERQPFVGEIKKYTEEEEICGKRKKNKRERKKSEGSSTWNTTRRGRWVSKLRPPSTPFFSPCGLVGAAESGFSRALAPINCQEKSVSNMRFLRSQETALHSTELLLDSVSFAVQQLQNQKENFKNDFWKQDQSKEEEE